MLPRQHRFANRQAVRQVLSKGKRIKTDIGILIVSRNQSQKDQTWKAAVIVGKKVAKKATERNAIRRQCYEAIWQIQTNIPSNIEFIFLPRIGDKKLLQRQISQALKTVLLEPPAQTDLEATNQ